MKINDINNMSSKVSHLDTVGVAGSIPVEPTISEGVSVGYGAPSFHFDPSKSAPITHSPAQKCEPGVKVLVASGRPVLVDADVYEWANQYKWTLNSVGYARRTVTSKTNPCGYATQLMHRALLGAKPGEIVDHVNGLKTDNRRCNLRIVSQSQNMANSRPRKGFKGVRKDGCRWFARIGVAGREIPLGGYSTQEDAARAYDSAALEHYGEHARTNFQDDGSPPPKRLTRSQSGHVAPKRRAAKSKYRGVTLVENLGPLKKPWKAAITINGRTIHLGYFATEEEAARAYDARAIEVHGEFARLNFPRSTPC
jgi:AP2-like factor (euAP2 lineage)